MLLKFGVWDEYAKVQYMPYNWQPPIFCVASLASNACYCTHVLLKAYLGSYSCSDTCTHTFLRTCACIHVCSHTHRRPHAHNTHIHTHRRPHAHNTHRDAHTHISRTHTHLLALPCVLHNRSCIHRPSC